MSQPTYARIKVRSGDKEIETKIPIDPAGGLMSLEDGKITHPVIEILTELIEQLNTIK